MSDTLTDAAPANDTAAPSVEDVAPGVTSEVDAGSGSDRVVPVERFNGLMSSFNKLQSEKAVLERQLSELRSGLNTKPEEEKPVVPDNDDIRNELSQLRELLLEERMKNVRRSVLDEYPDAKPFADLIVADTEEDLRQMAKLISDRVKGVSPTPQVEVPVEPTATETVEPEPVQPEAPVVGGGAAYDGESVVEDRVADAIRRRSFSDFLAARFEQMESQQAE